MARKITCLKVFIASPGGLAEERKAFREVIQEYNESESIPRGILFLPVGWEDTLGAVGRPQAIINEDVRDSDYFILLLWDRWGSRPDVHSSRFSSGTEEEYHVAMECYHSDQLPMRQLVLMFKSVDPQQMSDPGPQLQQVLEFRKKIEAEKTHLFHSFDTTEKFRKLLHKHLASWLLRQEEGWTVLNGGPTDLGPLAVEDSVTLPKEQLAQSSDSSLVEKAWALADVGRLTEAEVEFSRLIVGQSKPEPIIEFGRFLVRIGRLDQALVMFEGAARVGQDQKNASAVSSAERNRGIVLQIQGDLDGAEKMFRKALKINEKLGRLKGIAKAYGNLGAVLQTRSDLDNAEKMYRKALEIDKKLERLEGMATAYGNLGSVFKTRGDLYNAEQMYRKALEIDKKLERLEGMASQYGNLGLVLQTRGDLDSAEQMYRKALEIDEKLRRLEGMASHYGNLGNVLYARGEMDNAEQMYRKALDFAERLGSSELITWIKSLLDTVHKSLPESENAV